MVVATPMLTVTGVRPGDCRAQPLGQGQGVMGVGAGEQDREFLTAVAVAAVGAAVKDGNEATEGVQQPVALAVPVGVVEALEVVDAEEQQAQRQAGARGDSKLAVQVLFELPTVVQAGQGVGAALGVDLGVQLGCGQRAGSGEGEVAQREELVVAERRGDVHLQQGVHGGAVGDRRGAAVPVRAEGEPLKAQGLLGEVVGGQRRAGGQAGQGRSERGLVHRAEGDRVGAARFRSASSSAPAISWGFR